MTRPTETAAWSALLEHGRQMAGVHVRDLFDAEPDRAARMTLRLDDLLFDYSKHRVTGRTMELLFALADQVDLRGWIDRMFAGERINTTEDRAVLHVALRRRHDRPIRVDGVDVMPAVAAVQARMRAFTEAVRDGRWTGHTGRPVSDVVNIGIGGSDLGPAMVAEALRPYWREGLRVHFVSNVDGTHLAETLRPLDPETTLFTVASKSFTTLETLTNARSARRWLVDALGTEEAVASHFVAISANADQVTRFGIDPINMFEMWDWVGGRYSLWSAIGLPVALVIGMDRFEELLAGARDVDDHVRAAPWPANIPVIMGLLGVWYHNVLGASSHAVLPYDQSLRRLPAYLQQCDMESNGKGVDRRGRRIADYTTGPVIWGEPGTNGQHAFFQLLHQGTRLVPADFLMPVLSHHPTGEHHEILLANMLAQTEALMRGRDEAEVRAELEAAGADPARIDAVAPHRVFTGNRPTTTILFDRLDPRTLGRLIALYEHKVFVQGVVWNVNSFDQWGVELGKRLAAVLLPEIQAAEDPVEGAHDTSTLALLRHVRRVRRAAARDGGDPLP